MRMISKHRLRDLVSYIEFPALVSVFSVGALHTLQQAVNQTDLLHKPLNLLEYPIQPSFVGAAMGVAVGNAFKGDHHKSNALFAVPAVAIGVGAGYAVEHYCLLSPYAAAFGAAAAGMIFRRNFRLPEDMNSYDDHPEP